MGKGEYDKALDYYDKSLKIDLNIHGEEHPDTATSYNNIGLVYLGKKNPTKALHFLNKSFSIFNKIIGAIHPHTQQVAETIKSIKEKMSQ